jgi:predicted LPLAT superfamily acyltransferase
MLLPSRAVLLKLQMLMVFPSVFRSSQFSVFMLRIERLASADYFCPFVLGDLASFRNIYRHLIKFFESDFVRPSVGMEQLGSHWTDFH